MSAAPRPESVRTVQKIRLKDRLDDQFGGHLAHTVEDNRYSNYASPVEDIGDDGIPWLGFVRSRQVRQGDTEVKGAGISDLAMIIVHGNSYGTSRYSVVAMAQGVGQGFAGGAWGIPRLVLTNHFARIDPARPQIIQGIYIQLYYAITK
jgi:hypothetical protein